MTTANRGRNDAIAYHPAMVQPGEGMHQERDLPPIGSNAHAEVVEELLDIIIRGKIQPGQRIREVEIAAQFGVSRTPVREAFLVLAAEGLLTLQPGD